MVHFVLNEEVNEWQYGGIKCTRKVLAVLDGGRVARAQSNDTKCPGDGGEQIRDHENVMPIMVIGGCDVGPSTACQRAEDAHPEDEFWKG